uniref:Uncharacterized protein n=1 Tax=Rhipicephalus zambeziensis TaxID=60191 RepID=A0A224YGS2_9ACAR
MQNGQQPRPICEAFRSLAPDLKKPRQSRRNSKSKWLWRNQSGRTSSKSLDLGPPAKGSRSRPPQGPLQAALQPERRNAERRERNKRGPTGFRARGASTKS